MISNSPVERQWHRLLVAIPVAPPRRLTPRVWLAWLVHSRWTRLGLYLAAFPAMLLMAGNGALRRAVGLPASFQDLVDLAIVLAPTVAWIGALLEAVSFSRLVAHGLCAFTHVSQVRARAEDATGRSHGALVAAWEVTDVRFLYQGAAHGVNIDGTWHGRIRIGREPLDGQRMPVLFDRVRPGRRLVLWAYGLTVHDPLHDQAKTGT